MHDVFNNNRVECYFKWLYNLLKKRTWTNIKFTVPWLQIKICYNLFMLYFIRLYLVARLVRAAGGLPPPSRILARNFWSVARRAPQNAGSESAPSRISRASRRRTRAGRVGPHVTHPSMSALSTAAARRWPSRAALGWRQSTSVASVARSAAWWRGREADAASGCDRADGGANK